MTPVKAALLGIVHPHSLAHLRTLQQLPEVESILLWDTDEEALAATRQSQGEKVEATFTDLDALLSRGDLFFAIVAMRNDLGLEIFVRVLGAGKHLLAEKPIGKTAGDAERVIDAARRAGLQLGVCYQNRALPPVQDARNAIAQGLLGPLISVEMRMITTQPKFRIPPHWLFKREQAGGGVLSWLGCHYIDLMGYITQDEIVSVAAEMATRSGENMDVEDVAVLSLRFRCGAVGALHAGYILAQSGGGYFNRAGYDNYVGINGQLGRITWSSSGPPSAIYIESVHESWAAAPKRQFHYTYGESPAYGGVHGEQFVRDFILAAQGRGKAWASGDDALQVARVVDAAYESSRSSRRVDIAGGIIS
jgi:predicted dehydrogenase